MNTTNPYSAPAASDQRSGETAIDGVGLKAHLKWVSLNTAEDRSAFAASGFAIIPSDGLERDRLLAAFEPARARPLEPDDCDADYWPFPATPSIIDDLNARHRFFPMAPAGTVAHIESWLQRHAATIETENGGPFTISNVRFDGLLHGKSFGPSQWHHDGGPVFLRKILLYPGPLQKSTTGAIEFFDRYGEKHLLESEAPVAVLYDTAILIHRGSPPKTAMRPMIEITLCTTPTTDTRLRFAGHLARVPKLSASCVAPFVEQHKSTDPSDLNPVGPILTMKPRRSRLRRLIGRFVYARSVSERIAIVRAALSPAHSPGRKGLLLRDRGPVPLVGGQIANRKSYVLIGGDADFDVPGWVSAMPAAVLRDSHARASGLSARVPLATGSIRVVCIILIELNLNPDATMRLFREARRLVADDGQVLFCHPAGMDLSSIRPAGLTLVHPERSDPGRSFDWLPFEVSTGGDRVAWSIAMPSDPCGGTRAY